MADGGEYRADVAGGLVAGVLGGAACGVLMIVSPPVALGLFAAGIAAMSVRSLVSRPARLRYLATAAGLPIGLGTLFLVSELNRVIVCATHAGLCPDPNVAPLLPPSVAMVAVGIAVAAASWWRARPR